MKISFSIDYDIRDLWIGIFWWRTTDVFPVGAPSYELPIYEILHIKLNIIPTIAARVTFSWQEK